MQFTGEDDNTISPLLLADEESLSSQSANNYINSLIRRRTLTNRSGLIADYSTERQSERNVNFDIIPQIYRNVPTDYVIRP